jgi:hypothetical protein
VQRLRRASEALHQALLQSNPPAPGEDPVIHLFPAWPKEWNVRFKLAARGAFIVTAAMRGGRIEMVELESQAGTECKLRNPWSTGAVTIRRNTGRPETLTGSLLRFGTRKGERIRMSAA